MFQRFRVYYFFPKGKLELLILFLGIMSVFFCDSWTISSDFFDNACVHNVCIDSCDDIQAVAGTIGFFDGIVVSDSMMLEFVGSVVNNMSGLSDAALVSDDRSVYSVYNDVHVHSACNELRDCLVEDDVNDEVVWDVNMGCSTVDLCFGDSRILTCFGGNMNSVGSSFNKDEVLLDSAAKDNDVCLADFVKEVVKRNEVRKCSTVVLYEGVSGFWTCVDCSKKFDGQLFCYASALLCFR